MSTSYDLTIRTDPAIPVDVLVEHIAYHLRNDFKENDFFSLELASPEAVSRRYHSKDEHE